MGKKKKKSLLFRFLYKFYYNFLRIRKTISANAVNYIRSPINAVLY